MTMTKAERDAIARDARAEAKRIRKTHLFNIALAVAARSNELGKVTDMAEEAIANAIYLAATRALPTTPKAKP